MQKQSGLSCPVKLMKKYLKLRKLKNVFSRWLPDHIIFLFVKFKNKLELAGLPVKFYKGHPFCIGGATLAAASGCSDSQIQAMGRWKSGIPIVSTC